MQNWIQTWLGTLLLGMWLLGGLAVVLRLGRLAGRLPRSKAEAQRRVLLAGLEAGLSLGALTCALFGALCFRPWTAGQSDLNCADGRPLAYWICCVLLGIAAGSLRILELRYRRRPE